MGLHLFGSSCDTCKSSSKRSSSCGKKSGTSQKASCVPPNPDPNKFSIVRVKTFGRALVTEIYYVGCTNYEGHKILVCENITEAELRACPSLDPHFVLGSRFSPVARFEPTVRGWKMACKVARDLDKAYRDFAKKAWGV